MAESVGTDSNDCNAQRQYTRDTCILTNFWIDFEVLCFSGSKAAFLSIPRAISPPPVQLLKIVPASAASEPPQPQAPVINRLTAAGQKRYMGGRQTTDSFTVIFPHKCPRSGSHTRHSPSTSNFSRRQINTVKTHLHPPLPQSPFSPPYYFSRCRLARLVQPHWAKAVLSWVCRSPLYLFFFPTRPHPLHSLALPCLTFPVTARLPARNDPRVPRLFSPSAFRLLGPIPSPARLSSSSLMVDHIA